MDIKQDINFLEKPLWFQNTKNSEEKGVWIDLDNYLYRANYKLPDKVDMLFLFYMLLETQKAGYQTKISFSRYQILKGCNFQTDQKSYLRLKDSLERWLNVSIKFNGTFYDAKGYKEIGFHIIDDYKIEENNRVEIHFNELWLLKIKESQFFKYIDFDYYKTLKKPLSRRLFEILCKSFKGRKIWKIDLIKLGVKLTISKRKISSKKGEKAILYHSDVLEKIKPAINEINKLANNKDLLKTLDIANKEAFQIDFELDPRKKIISFTKQTPKWIIEEQEAQKASEAKDPLAPPIENTATLQELYGIAKSQTKAVQELIAMAFREKGFEYVKWNILYTNKEAKKNYAVFLKKALEENWGMEIQEVETVREKTEQTQREEKNKQLEASQKKNEEILRLNKEFDALPKEKQKQLREQAIDCYMKAGVPENFKIPNEMILAKVRDLLKSSR